MIRPSRLGVLVLPLISCGPASPTPPKAALRPPPPLHVSAPREPLRGYRLAESFVAKGPFRDGAPLRVGAMVNGLRVRPDASGLRLADSVAMPSLEGGVPLPDALGGGLLFWNDSALYTADSFLGTLTPLLDVGFQPTSVSFAPTFALVRGSNGDRLAVDVRTRQRVPITPALLADIAVTAGGRALALLEGGACSLSEDAGKSYRPLSLPEGTRAVSVREASGQLFAALTSEQQLRVDLAGNVQVEAASPETPTRPPTDSLWPLAEPPLEWALSAGVAIGEEFAGVAVAGSVATVNLRTGELVQVTRALVPSELKCKTLDANGALMLACNSPTNGSVVLSDVFGERPQTQAKFPKDVALHFAAGVLVAAARCDGSMHPGAVCVRGLDGRFHDFDLGARLTKLASAPPTPAQSSPAPPTPAPPSPTQAPEPVEPPPIVRWVPKVGGGAVALIGGSTPGLLDAQSGSFVAISDEALQLARENVRGREDWLGVDWIALADGSVHGWGSKGAVAISSDGRLEPSVYEFEYFSSAGAHALAFDRGQRVFQSTDWGVTWVETLAPPGFTLGGRANFAPHCSQVGCTLGPWLRVGWEAEVPAARVRTKNIATPPTKQPREPLRLLNCSQVSAPSIKELPPAEPVSRLLFGVNPASLATEADHQATFSWSTIHPIKEQGTPHGLRASFAIRAWIAPMPEPRPTNWPGYSTPARMFFVSPFDPNGRIQTAALTWRTLNEAATRAAVEGPSYTPEALEGFPALPVLGLNPGETAGLVLSENVPIWVRGSGGNAALSAGNGDEAVVWISAAQRTRNKLVMLGGHQDGTLDVVEFSEGRARRLFQIPGTAHYPSNPDALAIGAQGALAILRAPSGSEPATSADPAILLHEDGNVSTLAPWSRMLLADAPECKPAASDYRAVLQTSRAWLQLLDAAEPVTDELLASGMFAMVRGNAERLCLEAVELAAPSVTRMETTYQTFVSARFVGPEKGAGRLGFDSGFEYRQGLNCRLSAAR
ncbi:MAG TPA: hypothetical protein VER96_00615 [Polyangiaceae bacterium]|nr:hypothetical protein [Polyangiaceae bacterium]